jgi:D-alanine-D-alanine ligase
LKRDWLRDERAALQTVVNRLGFPVFVKPANLGSSVGISKAKDPGGLREAMALAGSYDRKIVIEAAVPDAREIECAVLGNDEPIASIPGEIVVDHPDGFYSYTAKYIDETGTTTRIPADLTGGEINAIQLLSLQTFRTLECAGLARIDFFRSKTGELFVNEINTLPGFTAISMYPKLWEASGIPPRELVGKLIDLAMERAARRSKLRTST